jgi:hypothetical protein
MLVGARPARFELLTAFPYIAAIALIIGSGVSHAGKLFLLLLYCVVYTLPLIGIAGAFAVLRDRAEAILRPVGDRFIRPRARDRRAAYPHHRLRRPGGRDRPTHVDLVEALEARTFRRLEYASIPLRLEAATPEGGRAHPDGLS